jgi:glycosyltransferase involved in cell wall biosynthesis
MTSLSFILTCRNAERFVAASVASILAIDESVSFELVVVDGGSDDRTGEILRAFSSRSLHVRVFESPSDLELAACRQIGTDEARGDYLFYLDANEFVAAGFLPEAYRELGGRPDLLVADRLDFDGRALYSRSGAPNLFYGVRRLGGALEYPACFQDRSCRGKFIRAGFLKETGLRFGTQATAEREFCARMWLHARDIRFFHKPMFVRDRQGCGAASSAVSYSDA